MRQVLHARLKKQDYDPLPVADAITALAEARKSPPDLIILDLGLPGGGGLSVMQRLQALPRLSTIPVIVISGQERSIGEQPSLDAGAASFFQKPVNPEELLGKIRELLGES